MRTTLLVLAVAALCFFDVAAADSVDDSCNAISNFVNVTFCTSKLRSVPGAATADRHGHLLMATDLAAASGVTAGNAATAATAGDDPASQDALRACAFLYGSASVPALKLLRGYAEAQSWGAARALLPLTEQAGNGCDAAIAGTAAAGAGGIAEANREFDQLSTMATALLNAVDVN